MPSDTAYTTYFLKWAYNLTDHMVFFSLSLEKLDVNLVRLYSAQLVHVLEYLQTKEIMHRDLKP